MNLNLIDLFDKASDSAEFIPKLRQLILDLAVRGKLVPQNPKDEPASELLKKIKAEKEKLVKDGKIRLEERSKPISQDEMPFDIPKCWKWCRMQELVDSNRGITYGIVKMGNTPLEGGVPALRCSDVKPRGIDISNVRFVSKEIDSQYQRTKLRGREVLLNVRGTLGGCAVVPLNISGYNIAREISLIPLHNDEMAEYIVNVLASPFFTWQVNSNLKGIAYKGLNLNILRNLLVPLPPIKEQKLIVTKVNELMSLCDALEKQISITSTQSTRLLNALIQNNY